MPNLTLATQPKARRRQSWEQSLKTLDAFAETKLTYFRLQQFSNIFAPRYAEAIITRVNQGPRSWTKLKGRIYLDHVLRHLMADLRPELPPQWIGARSFEESAFVCIDVDADRSVEDDIHEQTELTTEVMLCQSQSSANPVRWSYPNRCRLLEFVLHQLGVDANDKYQVLVQPTPSGGRHYYLFFKYKVSLKRLKSIFTKVGLRFSKGQFEFFPSTTQGLRLPFGHLPGLPHDPRRWIRFVEAYRRKQIVRHDPLKLFKKAKSLRNSYSGDQHQVPAVTTLRGKLIPVGLPHSQQTSTHSEPDATARYSDTPIKSTAEIHAIWEQGITQLGTRNAILKLLAAHLVYIRGLSAQAAATELIAWAMDARHRSHDIARDLERGTHIVADEIHRLCRWHEQHRDPTRRILSQPCFNQAEVQFIARHLEQTNPHNVATFASFLLHFLRFAKQHGTYDAEQQAWVSQPAVNAVIRKWPGCRAMQSKLLVEQAKTLGILKLIKGNHHNPNGKGRARTYQLHIPSEPNQLAIATLEQAEQQLLDLRISISRIINEASSDACQPPSNPQGECYASDNHAPQRSAQKPHDVGIPAALCQAYPRTSVDRSPLPSLTSQDAAAGLRCIDLGSSHAKLPYKKCWLDLKQAIRTNFYERGTSDLSLTLPGIDQMAHELATTNGRPAMCYYGETPWHRLGTKLDNPATASEAIAAAGLDYTVEKLPLFTTDGEEARQRQAVVRSDTREVLGVVGRGYTPIQNHAAFEFLDSVVQSNVLRYHTAGSLGRGERVFLLAKLHGEIRVKNSDDITQKFLLLSNSHDGSASMRVLFTPVRVVCANTLNLSLGKGRQGVSIQHRGDLDSKIVEARELLGFANHVYQDFQQQAEVLASYYLRAEQLENFFKALYPDPTTGVANRAISTRRELTRLFEEGRGQDIPQIRHSLWAAVNAVTEFVDHHRSSRGANTLDRDSRRLESQWFGSGAKLKAKAWETALLLAS